MNKHSARKRRSLKTRLKQKRLGMTRVCVSRSNKHLYVQVIETSQNGCSKVLCSASSVDKDLKSNLEGLSKTEVASKVGKLLAEKAIKAGVSKVAFDRSGYKYHGRVKALADAAREGGMIF